ncbi:hypothetical protein ACFRAO_11170 [Streptomyces sp. NPDC056656]
MDGGGGISGVDGLEIIAFRDAEAFESGLGSTALGRKVTQEPMGPG